MAASLKLETENEDADDWEIDLSNTITILSVSFRTKFPEAIKKKNPSELEKRILYDKYDDANDDDADDDSIKDSTKPKPKEIIFFTGKNFTGDSHKYPVGVVLDFPWFKGLDNQFKSVRIGTHCKVMIWEHTFAGAHKLLLEDTPTIQIGNGLTSFIVLCKAEGEIKKIRKSSVKRMDEDKAEVQKQETIQENNKEIV